MFLPFKTRPCIFLMKYACKDGQVSVFSSYGGRVVYTPLAYYYIVDAHTMEHVCKCMTYVPLELYISHTEHYHGHFHNSDR